MNAKNRVKPLIRQDTLNAAWKIKTISWKEFRFCYIVSRELYPFFAKEVTTFQRIKSVEKARKEKIPRKI